MVIVQSCYAWLEILVVSDDSVSPVYTPNGIGL